MQVMGMLYNVYSRYWVDSKFYALHSAQLAAVTMTSMLPTEMLNSNYYVL